MPNPKRRHSTTRSSIRRAHDALHPPSLSRCPRCGRSILPHTVCDNCGHYRGVEVIPKDEEE